MIITAAFGIYFALLGVVAYEDLNIGKGESILKA